MVYLVGSGGISARHCRPDAESRLFIVRMKPVVLVRSFTHPLFTFNPLLCDPCQLPQEEIMKLKFALVGLAALGSLAAAGTASAMPLAPLSLASNVESVALVCGPNGCIRTAPA